MFSSGMSGNNPLFQKANAPSTPAGALPHRMGQILRTFATNANLNNKQQHHHQTKMGIRGVGDESSAKVINRDNNYPNNERKTTENMIVHSESTIIIAATTSPVIDVGHSLTIISSMRRRVSECPSEDSYIVFEGCDSDLDDLDSIFGEDDDSDESDDDIYWEGGERDQQETKHQQQKTDADHEEIKQNCTANKKVHFPPDENLAVVHRMIMWSFAYRACRKGPWEEYVRDRARFLRRIDCCREDLSTILQPAHRDRIYKERFAYVSQEMAKNKPGYSVCGDQHLMDERKKKTKSPKRHKRRKNGKKKRKNRHRPRR